MMKTDTLWKNKKKERERKTENKKKKGEKNTDLYRRLSALGSRTDVNVGDTIDEWVKEGKSVTKSAILGYIRELRKYKKHDHAIQLFEWLDKRGRDLSHGDHAVRLDLIAKAKGLDSAEKYFMSLPESSKNKFTYGALLNCYCVEKMTDKAMDLLEKMKKLNCASTCLVYNNIISLHMKVGEPEKVPSLVKEMKEKSITPNVHTYCALINSYALLKDIDRAEGVLEEMKKDGVRCDWSTYANLASIYIKAGHFDKANSTLKEMEKRNDLREPKAFHILIGLYSHTSNRLGVDRVWSSLKAAFPKLSNRCYLHKLQALHRLGDTDGLKKCFEEWESNCANYDIRLVNVLIESYLNREMVKEAEALREAAEKKGGKPNFRTLEMLMNFYLKKRQVDSALKCLGSAASRLKDNEWKPSEDSVSMFLKYLEEEKDVDGAENLFKSLKKFRSTNTEVYESLIRTYIAAEKKEPRMRIRMKEDGIEITPGFNKLIGKVCPG
ncbi:Pentatricopeptide repeat-containing protein [Thalictrum thalictroides]|uniref:Pentatricopeptide repeat-containing protein n=1 Tax=Thalictrum thalictroides TaxID=46969 RepID=A0A7J6UZ36_THATH|nr:Pentatricopeptide repeat-containing protein [Thalictrum thalictroides]